eukprot:TRINITY_DN3846_c0_g1_i1.p1 TRINITY_DN3846_c0_g1~~TRINITY_DN3846_c0_g1_i1.p1  ORF type:complete len:725 (+),score=104.86 TRINITY_DN3846_c0_g1_i1:732-2906(+)
MIHKQQTAFMVRASYLQIYNEVISDLLKTDRSNLQIREDKRKGVFVEGLSEWAVRSPYEIYSLMRKGTNSRVTASTKLNDLSSRSHAVFIIIVEQMTTEDVPTGNPMEDPAKQIKVGKLNLVDLAGSERLSITGATGKRLEECKKINQSLSALGNVIAALTDTKSRSHIPYRDSKLTRLLEDSLGGNCKTTMMAMISPSYMCFSETLSSLKFANRAKNIKNNARINEDVDQRALLRKYEAELKSLRKALEEKNKDVMDKEVLYRLEEDKRKAEEDKAAMIRVLETRSREYMKEKEDKRKLEEKIKLMSSQMLLGGKKIEDTPQFRTALEEKQRIIHQEYEMKLQELEKERQQIEEDKAQVDRYKQLLLKQRDIMIALTARLNERDETIIQLQEELDAYDRIHKETEDKLENRMARVQMLENCLVNGGMQPPPDEEMDERPSEPQMDALRRRYPPYAADCSEGPSDGPLSLLTAEEKIAELMDIIEQQKAVLNQREAEPQPHLSSKLEELQQKEQEVIEQQELLAEAQDRMTMLQRENTALTEDKQKLLSQMESTMLGTLLVQQPKSGLAENALRGLKEQKDQYRLYHISQDVQNLQKTIMGVVSMFKYLLTHFTYNRRGVKHMPAPSEPKPPMAVLSMNQKVEDEGPRVFRKQVPLTTQEENIRRALRDYYAKKQLNHINLFHLLYICTLLSHSTLNREQQRIIVKHCKQLGPRYTAQMHRQTL